MIRADARLLLLAGFVSVYCAAQPIPRSLDTLQIKAIVSNIDSNLKALNRSRAVLQTGTDRGGELALYRRGSDVVRIDAVIGGSNSDSENVFYYSGTNPIFIRTKTITYPYSLSSNTFDFTNPHVKTAADYYVREGNMIPLGHAKIAPSMASRLLQQAKLFITAGQRGNQVVDIEKLRIENAKQQK
jgi:hypothetical protein